VFNRLRDKIRGRRRLPSHKAVLVFSPHPDDDVISMGVVLRKLWENENAIVVAYMTSGNIAVFDHDVRRHLDFMSRAAETLGLDRAAVQRVRESVEASFERKMPGDVDLPVVQDLKRMIRESEAIAALEAVGLPPGVAGVAPYGGERPGAALPGRIAGQGVRDLQAPVAEGHGAVPGRARRPRVLAAGRSAQPGDRGARRPAGPARVFRDGGLPRR